ncbi:melanization protease 1-like isoform X1 [Schistocerca cancellata]|uniref:melanization protease 1-like isoform X1 n=1 Tax=Schistocerca cancellata TaxID=274614 RepID=UPI0021191E94|nr:melanization protease 1-like isoform X1 [Schistocerca cancellata]
MAAGAPRLLCVCACVWLLHAPGSLAQSSRRAQRQECETTVLADRIYGGERATIGQYPWLALLQYRSPEGELAFLCGGALVSPRYVLTAAHCLQSKPSGGTLVSVRLGEFDVDSEFDCFEPDVNGTRVCADPPLDVEPERLLPHPGYRGQDNSYQNDIGLIRLNQEVMYTNNIRPICLPSPQDVNETYKNWQPTIAGWGRTETSDGAGGGGRRVRGQVRRRGVAARGPAAAGVRGRRAARLVPRRLGRPSDGHAAGRRRHRGRRRRQLRARPLRQAGLARRLHARRRLPLLATPQHAALKPAFPLPPPAHIRTPTFYGKVSPFCSLALRLIWRDLSSCVMPSSRLPHLTLCVRITTYLLRFAKLYKIRHF